MKFLLRKNLGQSSINEVGNHLRVHGSGHHWIEKYRGEIFVNVSDDRDAAILRSEYRDILSAVEQ